MIHPPRSHIRDVMNTRPVRVRHDSNIHQAAEIVALSGVSDLMVVDGDENFIGVLSEGDILRSAMPNTDEILDEGGTLDDAYGIFMQKGRHLAELPVEPLVIREPIVLDENNHVAQAAAILIDRNIRLLPVVKDGKLVGTVSRSDICRAVVGTAVTG
jgi:CBS domain-containing protein